MTTIESGLCKRLDVPPYSAWVGVGGGEVNRNRFNSVEHGHRMEGGGGRGRIPPHSIERERENRLTY